MSRKKLVVFGGLVCLTAQMAWAEPQSSSNPSIQPAASDEPQKGMESISGNPGEGEITVRAKILGPCRVLKGDINGDGVLDLGDVILLSNCIFLGAGNCAACYVGDANCDFALTPADLVKLILAIYWEKPLTC